MYCWIWKLKTNGIANLLKLLEMSKRKFLLRTGVALVGFGTLLTTVRCRYGNYFHHHRCYHHMDCHCHHYNSAWALALISLSDVLVLDPYWRPEKLFYWRWWGEGKTGSRFQTQLLLRWSHQTNLRNDPRKTRSRKCNDMTIVHCPPTLHRFGISWPTSPTCASWTPLSLTSTYLRHLLFANCQL